MDHRRTHRNYWYPSPKSKSLSRLSLRGIEEDWKCMSERISINLVRTAAAFCVSRQKQYWRASWTEFYILGPASQVCHLYTVGALLPLYEVARHVATPGHTATRPHDHRHAMHGCARSPRKTIYTGSFKIEFARQIFDIPTTLLSVSQEERVLVKMVRCYQYMSQNARDITFN
jgi:hypothetical protein